VNTEQEKTKCIKTRDHTECEIFIKDILHFIRVHHSDQNGIYLEFETKEDRYQIRIKDNKKLRNTMLKKVKEEGETKKRFVKTGLGGDGQCLGYYKYWLQLNI
jgi:anti-sigma regulatory factor (Ser/Thr protein kinase)